jgi:predicted O-methyltransferase YrrM
MSTSLGLTPEIVAYLASVNPVEHPAARQCREETAALGRIAVMQISAEQGALMQLLARLLGARRAIEVGVFTGYSALVTALTLQDMHGADAYLLACDVSEEWTAKGRPHWRAAGVEGVIDLQIRPAVETLDARLAQGEAGSFDLAFIDADKPSYPAYYERCLALLRPGGLMLFDNVLWSGAVADPTRTEADTVALRAVARHAQADARVHAVMAAVGDGLLLCSKR